MEQDKAALGYQTSMNESARNSLVFHDFARIIGHHCSVKMRAVSIARTSVRPRVVVSRLYAASKPAAPPVAGANPWANAPQDEAALREAILKASVGFVLWWCCFFFFLSVVL
jgi:hypothetical protein